MKLRTRLLMLAMVGTVATAGCASTVQGAAVPGMSPVDISTLRLGSFSPEPTTYVLPRSSTPDDVRRHESKRMLNYTILSTDVDPEIDKVIGVEAFTAPGDPFRAPVLPEKYRAAMFDNKLVAGTYVVRTNGNMRSLKKLIISVLRFPTEQAASKAGDQMVQATLDEPSHVFAVDGHPDVKASSKDWSTGTAYVTRGSYLLVTNYSLPQPDETKVKTNLKKALDLQLAKMADLKPTPFEDVLDIPFDPDGIMRRAMPEAADYSDVFSNDLDFYAYAPSGHLHFERNPALMKQAYADSGVDLIGRRVGVVYRAKDLAGAFRLQSALVTLGKNDEEIDPPPGLLDARCIQLYEKDNLRHYDMLCAVVRDRYVGVVVSKSKVTGTTNPALYERAAAQYAVLARSE
ncbi:hypothetical protein [Nocardia sp. NPDC058666]|uniref:DUF7373 family lipoprotein n=1 Tax=unclassified Nocardia TaxID=2637762 RepID=UPI00364AC276